MNRLTSQGPRGVSHTLTWRTSPCPLNRADCQGWERYYLLFQWELCDCIDLNGGGRMYCWVDSSADGYHEQGGKRTSADNLKSNFPVNFQIFHFDLFF